MCTQVYGKWIYVQADKQVDEYQMEGLKVY